MVVQGRFLGRRRLLVLRRRRQPRVRRRAVQGSAELRDRLVLGA